MPTNLQNDTVAQLHEVDASIFSDWCIQKPLQQGHSSWEGLKLGVPPAMPSSKNASSSLQSTKYTSSNSWPWDDLTLEVQICRRMGEMKEKFLGNQREKCVGMDFYMDTSSQCKPPKESGLIQGLHWSCSRHGIYPKRPGISLTRTKSKSKIVRSKTLPTN